jgi:nicotinamidase-related amidase
MIPAPTKKGEPKEQMEQVMWPRHCEKGSVGHEFAHELILEDTDIIQPKGESSNVDSYSGFFDNFRGRATGLGAKLHAAGVTDIFVVGLAYDFCAGSSACDAAELGFNTFLVDDCTKAVSPDSATKMRASLKASGVKVVNAVDVPKFLKVAKQETQLQKKNLIYTSNIKKGKHLSLRGSTGIRARRLSKFVLQVHSTRKRL